MQTIKDFFNILDYCVATLWGYTLIDIISIITGGVTISAIDSVIKLLFALAGLAYTLMRMYHFWHRSKIDRAIKREELEKIENYNEKNK